MPEHHRSPNMANRAFAQSPPGIGRKRPSPTGQPGGDCASAVPSRLPRMLNVRWRGVPDRFGFCVRVLGSSPPPPTCLQLCGKGMRVRGEVDREILRKRPFFLGLSLGAAPVRASRLEAAMNRAAPAPAFPSHPQEDAASFDLVTARATSQIASHRCTSEAASLFAAGRPPARVL